MSLFGQEQPETYSGHLEVASDNAADQLEVKLADQISYYERNGFKMGAVHLSNIRTIFLRKANDIETAFEFLKARKQGRNDAENQAIETRLQGEQETLLNSFVAKIEIHMQMADEMLTQGDGDPNMIDTTREMIEFRENFLPVIAHWEVPAALMETGRISPAGLSPEDAIHTITQEDLSELREQMVSSGRIDRVRGIEDDEVPQDVTTLLVTLRTTPWDALEAKDQEMLKTYMKDVMYSLDDASFHNELGVILLGHVRAADRPKVIRELINEAVSDPEELLRIGRYIESLTVVYLKTGQSEQLLQEAILKIKVSEEELKQMKRRDRRDYERYTAGVVTGLERNLAVVRSPEMGEAQDYMQDRYEQIVDFEESGRMMGSANPLEAFTVGNLAAVFGTVWGGFTMLANLRDPSGIYFLSGLGAVTAAVEYTGGYGGTVITPSEAGAIAFSKNEDLERNQGHEQLEVEMKGRIANETLLARTYFEHAAGLSEIYSQKNSATAGVDFDLSEEDLAGIGLVYEELSSEMKSRYTKTDFLESVNDWADTMHRGLALSGRNPSNWDQSGSSAQFINNALAEYDLQTLEDMPDPRTSTSSTTTV